MEPERAEILCFVMPDAEERSEGSLTICLRDRVIRDIKSQRDE